MESIVTDLDRALSSEQILKSIVEGLPQEIIAGVQRTLTTERNELKNLLKAYQDAKTGDFTALKEQTGNDPGAFLIAARIMRGFSQKELARKLGLREQAIQRWETERYRSISLANYLKVARTLGVRLRLDDISVIGDAWDAPYDVPKEEMTKVLRHARDKGWFEIGEASDENASSTLIRYVGDHVIRYGTPSLLRTGLNIVNHTGDWSLLSWKAQITRQAEDKINKFHPIYRVINVSWLMDLVRLSRLENGPKLARDFLLDHGIVLITEPQIPGMTIDGAAFLIEDVPVIGMTLRRDTIDNFWFTLLHEVAHIVLHYRTGLSSGFFDDTDSPGIDEFEEEANQFASNILLPEQIWARSTARIAKTPEPIEKLANQIGIHPAIIFGRIQMERNDYKIFTNRIGRGTVRKQLFETA
ncbi:XRE family transcriptional regulator [Nitrospirillum sp. BR 11752]|uniref:XRE family transcriptional regulator n=1 Tax=Nitrospirillum sp. BR 11752 TaxID=3104293 RepID=UPI002EC245D9|nr:XRE family transcriptional regulator [Nitrospirillum sp. BR 11752]